MTRALLVRALLLVAGCFSATLPAMAAEPGEYGYLFVQGRIANPVDTRPVPGVLVRLVSGVDVYEVETDQRGVFVFEKLPVREYEIQITTADGKVIEAARPLEVASPSRERLMLYVGRGAPADVRLAASAETEEIEVLVPELPPNWSRFWKQFSAFIGGAGLLLLL